MFKVIGSLSLIAGLRFFGLFVVMPVLSLYAISLNIDHKDDMALVGFAISAYAISQIVFQIPFGILGDRYSKRNVIAFGLVIFIIGSLICAYATSIEMIIIGRIIQGAGAIGSVVSAKITDLVLEEKRGSAMAFMGIAIFISFILAMIVGPSAGMKYGVDKLFILTAILSFFSIILLYTLVPKAPHLEYLSTKGVSKYKNIIKNKNIMILNLSVLIQKFLMTFAFTIIPVVLVHHLGMNEKNIWIVFALSAIIGLFMIIPSMIISEKYKKPKIVLLFGIILFCLAFVFMGMGDAKQNLMIYSIGVILFFGAFCIQEPILQNLASKYPKMQEKSLSLGIFTTFGYLGSFFGGIIGGKLFNHIDFVYIAIFVFIFMIVWFVILLRLINPSLQENLYISLDKDITNLDSINSLNGVIESYINKSQKLLIIKYNNKIVSKEKLSNEIRKFL
ncbi:MFS transporter [Helicobacter sp. MIT 99-5507]|uniref:MFS transporter n=1 Tax=Helicobacter sp. MIT 99-5507 TaxID=152489 RepID=UPI000E1EFA7C|nr:MFS transporter [Helicobacter sp. MIT 99-5507]RDU56655.1 MFS transporter [Helicobacter sp. MIT 99-5507]